MRIRELKKAGLVLEGNKEREQRIFNQCMKLYNDRELVVDCMYKMVKKSKKVEEEILFKIATIVQLQNGQIMSLQNENLSKEAFQKIKIQADQYLIKQQYNDY